MNKAGYTMIELMAVIAIIGLIFTIGIISYSSLIQRSNDTVYESYMDGMHEAAQTYVIDHPVANGGNVRITLGQLIDEDKIEYINNPRKNSDKCLESYVDAKRDDKGNVVSYEYNVCLECAGFKEGTSEEEQCRWTYASGGSIPGLQCNVTPNIPSNPSVGDMYCVKVYDVIDYIGNFRCTSKSSNTQISGEEYYVTLSECQNAIPADCDPSKPIDVTCHEEALMRREVYEYTCQTVTVKNNCKTYIN